MKANNRHASNSDSLDGRTCDAGLYPTGEGNRHRAALGAGLSSLVVLWCTACGSGEGEQDTAPLACEVSNYCVTVPSAVCGERNGLVSNKSCSDLAYTCNDDDRNYRADDPDCPTYVEEEPVLGICLSDLLRGTRCVVTTEDDCDDFIEQPECVTAVYPWSCGRYQYDTFNACNDGCESACVYLGDEADLVPGACAAPGGTVCHDGLATECRDEFTEGEQCVSEGFAWRCDDGAYYVDEYSCVGPCAGSCTRVGGEVEDSGAPAPSSTEPASTEPEDVAPSIAEDEAPRGGGVLAVNVIANEGKKVEFEIDVFVIDGDGDAIGDLDAVDLDFEDAVFDNPGEEDPFFTFEQTCFQAATTPENGPYSAVMLMDQSGSIAGTDPGDSRIDAAKIFFGALGEQDEAILAAFASDGSLGYDFISWGEFGTQSNFDSTLDTFPELENGGTPLYDATLVFTDKVADEGNNTNKAVVVFTDGDDTESVTALGGATANALAKGVKLFTVGLSSAVDRGVLQQLAFETGGSMMYTDEAADLVSLYGTLGNLLSGGVSYYHTCWTVEQDLENFTPGGWFSNSMQIKRPDGNYAYVPVYVAY